MDFLQKIIIIIIQQIIMFIFLFTLLGLACLSDHIQTTIHYDILNVGHHINLALQNYFNQSAKVQINYNQSSDNINSLDISITKDPILNVSSLLLNAPLKNGTRVSFNQSEVLVSRSIYNQPNTIFLMQKNIIFSIRYQYSLTDTLSYVQAIKIEEKSNCTQLQLIEYNSQYFLVVGCLKNNQKVVLISYKFQMNTTGVVLQLKQILPHLQLSISSLSNQCNRIQMHAYRQFLIKSIHRYNGVIVFCAQTIKKSLSEKLYFVQINKRKAQYYLANTEQVINDFQTIRFATCLRGSSFTTEYQKGFLSLNNNTLMYYSYGGQCVPYIYVDDKKFISSISESETQYIYIIFSNKIIIKQSYSPNFQVLYIKEQSINNMTLNSYSITRKFLSLLYQNDDQFVNLVYDLSTVYPNKVNSLKFPKIKQNTTIKLLSVSNFLQTGNYFFIYIQQTNQFNLYYYKGYQVDITVTDPQNVLPQATVYLSYLDDNRTDESLKIHITVRDFDDSTIVKAQNSEIAHNFKKYLNLNLNDYIIGPLGKFYTYSNTISAFQYVNYYTEINISDVLNKENRDPIGLSVNNVISAPLINFYYGYLTKTCEVYFNITNKLVRLRDCKTLSKGKTSLQDSKIITLSQGKYIQYNKDIIQYCSLSSSNEYSCMNLIPDGITNLQTIKLISYYYTRGENEIIEMIIYNEQQMAFGCFQRNQFQDEEFRFILHYFLNQDNILQLKSMIIKDLYFDQGYHNFMVLHFLQEKTKNHKIVIYDKIDIQANSSHSFIGHVIESFSIYDVQAVFCIKNLLIIIYMENWSWVIKQYKISKFYILKYIRQYPLYNYIIQKGGKHAQNQNFIYLQVYQQLMKGNRFFVVYSPLKSSFSVMSHKFQRKGEQEILFAQQIGQDNNNSMGINGQNLFGLTQPSLIFKMTQDFQRKDAQLYLTRLKFNLSVVDNNNEMNILQYNFIYNQGQQNIYFNINDTLIKLQFQADNDIKTKLYQINPINILGPVNQYEIKVDHEDDSNCRNFNIIKRDVFTKKQCLVYHNSYQYGIMSDFTSVEIQSFNIEVIVTDLYLFCIKGRSFSNTFFYNLSSLQNCKFHQGQQIILMTCDNTTSMSKEIFIVNTVLSLYNCQVSIQKVNIPSWFTYVNFQVQFNQQYIILEVPIRFQSNKIYFKASFQKGVISNKYSILTIQRADDVFNQSEFQTIDISISNNLFLILQNGIGIYNLSDTIESINPALWITKQQIQQILFISPQNNIVYLKHLFTQDNNNKHRIVIQLGTQSSTYDIQIVVALADSILEGQTKYILQKQNILYEYQQYINCKNTRQSESRRYNQMIIKICSYQPPDLFVFANFISITNQTSNYLIQFYHAAGTRSYPFRIQNIYSNLNSYDSFSIRKDILIVGSLFNLLCYYNLASNIQWEITYHQNPKTQQSSRNIYEDIPDEICQAHLLISNNQFQLRIPIQMIYIYPDQDDSWSDYRLYIQRAILFFLLLNTLRLAYRKRKEKRNEGKMRLTKKSSNRLHTSRFEVLVKINSKLRI